MSIQSEAEFWGEHGRVGVIQQGDLQGRHVLAYPETREPWWTLFVETGPEDEVPGDRYFDDTAYFQSLIDSWDVRWLKRGSEETRTEAELFGQRPLSGSSWLVGRQEIRAAFSED